MQVFPFEHTSVGLYGFQTWAAMEYQPVRCTRCTIITCMAGKVSRVLNLADFLENRQTAKFNTPAKFLLYIVSYIIWSACIEVLEQSPDIHIYCIVFRSL